MYGDSVPPLSTPGFVFCDGVYIEQSQTPRSLIPMTDEEQRLWAFQRVASSRGRGRGITPAPWAPPRSVGGHLQQSRNWRSPEKPLSSGSSQPAMSASSQFNYWRKNSLNEDEKVLIGSSFPFSISDSLLPFCSHITHFVSSWYSNTTGWSILTQLELESASSHIFGRCSRYPSGPMRKFPRTTTTWARSMRKEAS